MILLREAYIWGEYIKYYLIAIRVDDDGIAYKRKREGAEITRRRKVMRLLRFSSSQFLLLFSFWDRLCLPCLNAGFQLIKEHF